MRSAHTLLATVSHLASGAKHFQATAEHHQSVQGVDREPDYGTAVLGRARLDEMRLDSRGSPALVTTADDGTRYTAVRLAELVMDYWLKELDANGLHDLERNAWDAPEGG